MPREKPKLREETIEVPGLGSILIRNIPMSRKLEMLSQEGFSQKLELLQAGVLDADGSSFGWEKEDWDVFASNYPKSCENIINAIARLSDFDGAEAKKDETQS